MFSGFRDRQEAGRLLAQRLTAFRRRGDVVVVIALPRGGVPIAAEIAAALDLPLNICVVRKLGVPGQEELAMGAIASGGLRLVNEQVVAALGISPQQIEAVAAREFAELQRRERRYRLGRPVAELAGRIVILVDDGLATGATMRAALDVTRARGAAKVVIAVPVAPRDVLEEMEREADLVVYLYAPHPFNAIGAWYEHFPQLDDDEVCQLLRQSRPGVREGQQPGRVL